MKKTILLSFIAFGFTAVSAQLQLVESNSEIFETVRKSLNSAMNYNFIGYDNSDFYLMLGNRTLCKLDADITKAETFILNEKFTGEALFNFNGESAMGLIGFSAGNNSLIFNKFTLLSDENDFSKEQVASLDLERGDEFKFIVCENSNKTAKAALVTLISKDKEYRCSYVLTFSAEGDLLWQTKIAPHFEKPNFTFDDIALTNDANTVFVLGKSYNFRDEIASNTVLELLQINSDSIADRISEQCTFAEIRSMKCKILNNNNLFISGFYKDGSSETDDGTFSALYNTNINNFELTAKTFKESLARGAKPGTVFKSDYTKKIVGIYELSDTNIVVIGEDRQTKIMRNAIANNTSSPSYMFNAGNIFVEFYAADGSLKRISVIYKNQIGEKVDVRYLPQIKSDELLGELRHVPIAVSAIQSNDKLFLIFNDNVQNPVHQNIARREDFKEWDIRTDGATFLSRIEGNTIGRRKTLLLNAKNTNRIFTEVSFADEHKALLLIQLLKGKYDFTFEKLTY